MKEQNYLPENPVVLVTAMEAVCNLPKGAQIIGVMVVMEDSETIQAALLANKDSVEWVKRSMRRTMEGLENGGLPTVTLLKEEGSNELN